MIPFIKENIDQPAQKLSKIEQEYQLEITTYAEEYSLEKYGIFSKGCCNFQKIKEWIGKDFPSSKTRKNCHCVETTDIGSYNSCPHFCKYCYVNYQEEKVRKNVSCHAPESILLIGHIEENDI